MRRLWMAGDLRFLLRRHGQTEIYNFVEDARKKDPKSLQPFVLECHRRLGKSFYLLLKLVERCFRVPYSECKYGAPTRDQVSKIVVPNLNVLLRLCPDDLRPRKSGDYYYFKNPAWGDKHAVSYLLLAGLDYKDGDLLRGTACDEVALDEVRDVTRLRYVYEDVLLYQFWQRERPACYMATTPPRNMDHDYITHFFPMSVANNRQKTVTVPSNKDFTKEDERIVLEIVGSKESTGWRREALCQHIPNRDDLVVPEFIDKKKEIVEERKRPELFFPQVTIDSGLKDYTGILFGYVDFLSALKVFEDEIWVHYKSTGEIANLIRQKENELWKGTHHYCNGRIYRYGDMTAQQLFDLGKEYKMRFLPAEKYDADSALNMFRDRVLTSKVRVNPRCKNLIYQLEHATWNRGRTDLERTARMGHADLLKAAVYASRMAKWTRNPGVADPYDKDRTFSFGRPQFIDETTKALLVATGKRRLN